MALPKEAQAYKDALEMLGKILIEGRGGGIISPLDPQFGIGGEALPGSKRKVASRSGSNTRQGKLKIAVPKRTRKVSRYQRVFGKHLKMLKKKHPRTNISVLMKKAHRMTRGELR